MILELQTIARDAGHPVPLLIALDQENGGVNSLYDELYIRQFPSAMGIAATGSQSLAREVAMATAQEMKAVGVNWLLGPVLDVLTNVKSQPIGVRTMGDDPLEVSRYGVEFMKGFQEAGLATCGKHFPSYGNLEFLNSHTEANEDASSAAESPDQANHSALAPFRNTIAQGLDAMMVGGVPMSSTGANVMHGSLSEHVVHRLLRECLDFQGVVVSECLEMEALTHSMGISGGTVMAKNAGCDIILLCRSFAEQQEAINGLQFGIESGIIGRAQVEQSLRRVLRMKARCTSWEQALNPPGLQALAQMQLPHASLSQKAYRSSISVVRDKRNLLPLTSFLDPSDELLLLTPLVKPLPTSAVSRAVFPQLDLSSFEDPIGWDRTTSILSGESVFKELGRSLARQRHGRVLHTSYTANGVRPIHEHLIDRASAVIVVTTDAIRHLYQQSFTKHVSMLCRRSPDLEDDEDGDDDEEEEEDNEARDKPLVVVAASSPYDFTTDRSIETYICTYDFTEAALETVVQVLNGKLSPMGTLPGSVRRSPKVHQARHHWLVEAWNEERDSHALDALLDTIRVVGTSAQSSQLMGVTANSFLLRRPETVLEDHLVVRSIGSSCSTTTTTSNEIYGFCATYFFQSTGTGAIGSLIVHPARQNLSIGSTLHHRAIRSLLQRKGLQRLQLGCCFPGIYLGIPANHPAERKRLRQWFANRGWKTGLSRPVHSMLLRDLPAWAPPEATVTRLQQQNTTTIRYELLFGWDHAEAVLDYVKMTTTTASAKKNPSRLATQDLDLYRIALRDAPNCGIIRAVRVDDGVAVGSVIVYNAQSVLAGHSQPFLQTRHQLVRTGGLAALITTPSPTTGTSGTAATTATTEGVAQGLVLLGTKQLRKQGTEAVVLDSVSIAPPTIGREEKRVPGNSKLTNKPRSTTASSSACPQWASAKRIGPKRSMGC